jgi:cytochrome b6-f complex iron-sulfur subunit
MALTRRELLVLGGGVVCARAIGCGGGGAPIVLDKNIPAGNASSIAVNTLSPVSGKSVAIGRDGAGIYALSLVCTHEGCDIPSSSGAVVSFAHIHCGCHGSDFNGQGNVLLGPATLPLPHLEVVADATGALTIHGDKVVAANTRLTV